MKNQKMAMQQVPQQSKIDNGKDFIPKHQLSRFAESYNPRAKAILERAFSKMEGQRK